MEKVVLPCYVEVSYVTATSVQLPKQVCNDIDKVLKNFLGSITVSNVQNVNIDYSSYYYLLDIIKFDQP